MRQITEVLLFVFLLVLSVQTAQASDCPLSEARYVPFNDQNPPSEQTTALIPSSDENGFYIKAMTYDADEAPLASVIFNVECITSGSCRYSIPKVFSFSMLGINRDLTPVSLETWLAPDFLLPSFNAPASFRRGRRNEGPYVDAFETYQSLNFVKETPHFDNSRVWVLHSCAGKPVKVTPKFTEPVKCPPKASPQYVPHPSYDLRGSKFLMTAMQLAPKHLPRPHMFFDPDKLKFDRETKENMSNPWGFTINAYSDGSEHPVTTLRMRGWFNTGGFEFIGGDEYGLYQAGFGSKLFSRDGSESVPQTIVLFQGPPVTKGYKPKPKPECGTTHDPECIIYHTDQKYDPDLTGIEVWVFKQCLPFPKAAE